MESTVPKNCDSCPFNSRTITYKGPIDSPLVIVGESPGSEELRKGIPFVGASGQLLDSVFRAPVEPLVVNSISCFPGNPAVDSRDKREKEQRLHIAVNSCNKRLHNLLKKHPRKVIIALGNAAAWAITGDHTIKITKERGNIVETPLATNGALLTVHPAYLLRGGGSLRQFRRDLQCAQLLFEYNERMVFKNPTFEVIESKEQLKDFVNNLLQKAEYIAADIETGGFKFRSDKLLCMGLSFDGSHVYIIPADLLQLFTDLGGFDVKGRWIWHNGKFDIKFLRYQLNAPARVDEDTMLLSYANDEIRGIHDLEQVGTDWLGSPNYKNMLEAYLPNKKTSYAVIPKDVLFDYLAKDVAITFQVFGKLRKIVRSDKNTEKLYTRTLIPASELLARTELNGIEVDQKRVKTNSIELQLEINRLGLKLNSIAEKAIGQKINPNSPVQVKKLLFDGLKLKIRNRIPTSTNVEVLKKLPKHPAVATLLEYRKQTKAFGTYVKNMPTYLEDDGRVHATFKLHGTVTGRLASSDPNVQNIPRLARLRDQFVAPEGKILMETDLNQAELRSLAVLSGDEFLCKIYESEHMSLHDEVAIELFGKDFDYEDKMRAKAVNFGIIYGRTAVSIALEFGISMREAQSWIDTWFKRFPKAHEFIQKCRAAPSRRQSIITTFGRKKRFGVLSNINMRNVLNEASNFPHQSIASDITLHAAMIMTRCGPKDYLKKFPFKRLKDFNCKLINLIHDSVLIEVPDDEQTINEVAKLTVGIMEAVPKVWGLTRIPFKADVDIGKSWGTLKKFLISQ